MLLVDVNVLINAFNRGAPRHAEYRQWLEKLGKNSTPFGMSELVLSSFVRIATTPRLFGRPVHVEEAFEFTRVIRSAPACIIVHPGSQHWSIFEDLCRLARVSGPRVTDAYLAALAIESGSEWITDDHDFARFPGLKWRHPLQ